MTATETSTGPESQTLEGAKDWLRRHLQMRRYPMNFEDEQAAAQTIEDLAGIDPDSWSQAWLATASRFAARAEAAEAGGDLKGARDAWWQAYQFAFLGRYPVPDHPAKQVAYEKTREYFQKAGALAEPPVERVEVPFSARTGEGDKVAFYVVRPAGVENPPVLVYWAGIDGWKEESLIGSERYWRRGIATIHTDMPGVGEAPVLAGTDAERMWDPVFDWIADSDLDEQRVAVMGGSFGGYWATKLAHTHRDRLKAAVNWGGGIHLTFQPSWQEQSRNASSYLMDLMGARARIFGGSTFEDYVAHCPQLSLLDQGVLDMPCCPLLMVNGKDDLQNASADITLALEYGDPKTARLYPGGHMGGDMKTIRDVIAVWLREHLLGSSAGRD
ncbi:alpha/beta hydrolase family protein [Mycobacterium deserti]|uniref:Esterase FrsA n=1 Tax=Mycobacterium deserti TaxID=2978347 RepID=A0ABT2M6W1_9MYCO|nr:esterase FrsA [Mycobacterium deserti]MCT7657995.1 esterase FrsA [Mycobacterium deserti]